MGGPSVPSGKPVKEVGTLFFAPGEFNMLVAICQNALIRANPRSSEEVLASSADDIIDELRHAVLIAHVQERAAMREDNPNLFVPTEFDRRDVMSDADPGKTVADLGDFFPGFRVGDAGNVITRGSCYQPPPDKAANPGSAASTPGTAGATTVVSTPARAASTPQSVARSPSAGFASNWQEGMTPKDPRLRKEYNKVRKQTDMPPPRKSSVGNRLQEAQGGASTSTHAGIKRSQPSAGFTAVPPPPRKPRIQ